MFDKEFREVPEEGPVHRTSAVVVLFWLISAKVSIQNAVAQSAPGMRRSVVIPKLQATYGARRAFALSPDGASVAYLHVETIGQQNESSVDIIDTRSARTVFSYALPAYEMRFNSWESWNTRTTFLYYCEDGKYLIAPNGYGETYVLDTRNYQLHVILDLKAGRAEKRDAIPMPNDPGPRDAQAVCAARGDVIAFRLSEYSGAASVRAFNLDSGQEIALPSQVAMIEAISPDGSRLAVGSGEPYEVKVFDLRRDHVFRIPVTREIVSAGKQLCFVGDWRVAFRNGWTSGPVPGRPTPFASSQNPDPSTFLAWNIETGAVSATKIDPDLRGAGFIDVSADGRVVLSDAGKANWCNGCSRSKQVEINYSEITLWSRETGAVIAKSPHLPIIHHSCPLISFDILGGECYSYDEAPRLSLSANGNAVLVYWASGGKPVEVFFAPHS